MEELLPTTVMGSYPQPGWLVDRELLVGEGVPRVRAEGIWRIDREFRQEAIEAAVLVTIADQEAAGVDIITDGEIGRESYFNHFANGVGGIDTERLGKGVNRRGGEAVVPLVNGPIHRIRPIELDAARFLRSHTSRRTKVTVPGPFTLSQLAQNDYYPDQRSLAMAYAAVITRAIRCGRATSHRPWAAMAAVPISRTLVVSEYAPPTERTYPSCSRVISNRRAVGLASPVREATWLTVNSMAVGPNVFRTSSPLASASTNSRPRLASFSGLMAAARLVYRP